MTSVLSMLDYLSRSPSASSSMMLRIEFLIDSVSFFFIFFFFSSRRRHTRFDCDWSSDGALPILRQPANGLARSVDEAVGVAAAVGYPVVVRPSYVLGGRAMEIVTGEEDLRRYMREAVQVSPDHPILVDRYVHDAIEVDVDCVADGVEVVIGGVMEHIEEAGIHSGDSACSLPPYSIPPHLIAEIERQTKALALELGVVGLMNVQFALRCEPGQ